MTDWFSELNGGGAAASAPDAPQARDWFSELNGGVQQVAGPKTAAPEQKQGWGEWAANLPARAYKAAQGTHDPAFRDVPAYDTREGANSARLWGGALMGADDKTHADLIQKDLGDKFIRKFQDANGYDIIEHKDADGQPVQSYVNKPGLDMADVTRGAVSAVPYAAGGAALGALKGGVFLQGVLQGTGAAATSVAGDIGNSVIGGKQGVDPVKSIVAGAAGSAAPVVSPIVGGLWRRFVTVPGLVDANGKLTAKGVAAAKTAGIDDASALEGQIAREFAKDYAKTGDAAAAALRAESGAYGVETTLGQRTKDPMQLLREKGYRMGNYGDGAKQAITGLEARQADQIERMVRGNVPVATGVPKVEPGMLERLAPNKPYVSTSPASLGQDIRSGVVAARGAAKDAERAAWADVPDLVPRQEAFSDLAPLITDKLGGRRLSTSTPKAMEMDAALSEYSKGEVVASGTKLVNQSPIQTVDDMRRHLKDMLFAVDPNNKADVAAATAMYDGFKDWINSSAKKALLNGEVDKAANLMKAVDHTREMKQIFEPKGRDFKPNAATRIMKTVAEDATPERIVSALFGSSNAGIKDGAIQALGSIKTGLNKYTPNTAAETWNSIRVAHWASLIEGKDGKLLTPHMMAKNIDQMLRSQSTLAFELYKPSEMREMMRVARVLKGLSWKDPNPSGTATAAQGIAKEFFGSIMRALPVGNGVKIAAEFSGMPNRLRNASGYVGANNAVSQRAATMTNPDVVGPLVAGTNALYEASKKQDYRTQPQR